MIRSVGKWQPRRPTLLLLDDPRPGDAKAVIATLARRAEGFLYPVRLLIVNQSAPAEILVTRDLSSPWYGEVVQPFRQPIIFSEGGFTARDIRELRGSGILPVGLYPISTDREVERFLRITKGNPFLVELGFKWLRDGKILSEMTEARLLTERVDRIEDALQQAGLPSLEHRCAIAVATLAGDYSGSVAAPENKIDDPSRSVIERTFSLPENFPEALRRVFPIDTLDLAQPLPPIRPEMVGDAFVRRVFEQCAADQRQRLIKTAWLANARGCSGWSTTSATPSTPSSWMACMPPRTGLVTSLSSAA